MSGRWLCGCCLPALVCALAVPEVEAHHVVCKPRLLDGDDEGLRRVEDVGHEAPYVGGRLWQARLQVQRKRQVTTVATEKPRREGGRGREREREGGRRERGERERER